MPRAGADVDVEALVRRAKTRLNALYGIQHVRANARASDGANGDDRARAIRDADAREVARGLFADDEDGDRTSLAMVKMAFCAVERKRRLERWEYGAEWLARAERDLTKARVECGEREIPAWFLKPDCDYAIEEEGDVWMTFERAGRAVARRAVRRMRDGYALVPKRELAETYAAAGGARDTGRLRSGVAEDARVVGDGDGAEGVRSEVSIERAANRAHVSAGRERVAENIGTQRVQFRQGEARATSRAACGRRGATRHRG